MTNKDYTIELQHQVTGRATQWRIARFPSPSVSRLIERREALLSEQKALKVGGQFDLQALSDSDQKRFIAISKEFDECSFKIMAMVLDPLFELPEGVNKSEYLAECVGVYEVFDMVIGFFLSICSSSGRSPEGQAALRPEELSRMVTIRRPQAS